MKPGTSRHYDIKEPSEMSVWRIWKYAKDREFTRTEWATLILILQGKSNPQIADQLCVCEKTTKFTLTRILLKTKSKTRLELIAKVLGLYADVTDLDKSLASPPFA